MPPPQRQRVPARSRRRRSFANAAEATSRACNRLHLTMATRTYDKVLSPQSLKALALHSSGSSSFGN